MESDSVNLLKVNVAVTNLYDAWHSEVMEPEDSALTALTPELVYLEIFPVESGSQLCSCLQNYCLLSEAESAPYETIALDRLSKLQVSFMENLNVWCNGVDGGVMRNGSLREHETEAPVGFIQFMLVNPMETRLSEHETELPMGFIHFMDNKIDGPADRATVQRLLGEWLDLDELSKIMHISDASFLHTRQVLSYLKAHLPA